MKPRLIRVRPASPALWYAVFAGPIVWAAHFLGSYFLSEKTCHLGPARQTVFGINESKVIAFSFTVAAEIALGLALTFAIRRWSAVRNANHQEAPPNGRDVFLAVYAIASTLLFGLLIITEGLPNLLLLPVCD